MGYDTDYFEEPDLINEELICSICSGVLENPLTTHCDHLFCSNCIRDWLREHHTCPIDRCSLRTCMLKPAPRVIRNLINRLRIFCPYRDGGCKKSIPLEQYESHRQECEYNPQSMVRCTVYCHRMMTRMELNNHDCLNELDHQLTSLKRRVRQQDKQLERLTNILFLTVIISLFMYFFLPFPTLCNRLSILEQNFWEFYFGFTTKKSPM